MGDIKGDTRIYTIARMVCFFFAGLARTLVSHTKLYSHPGVLFNMMLAVSCKAHVGLGEKSLTTIVPVQQCPAFLASS